MVAHGDHQVGRLVDALDALGLSETTLLLVTSDHGGQRKALPTNGALRGYKGDFYEGGIRVPMLARWPGHVPGGSTSPGVFAGVDVVPTLLDLAGVATAGRGLEGISLLETLVGGASAPRSSPLFWEGRQSTQLYAPPESWYRFAVRRGPLKLVDHGDGRGPELYHLGIDPNETNDFAASQPGLAQELVDEYRSWRDGVARVDVRIEAGEGAARAEGDWLEFTGGALRYGQDTRLRFADGDFTFRVRVFPRRIDGEQVIAEHEGAWRLALVEGRLRLLVHHGTGGQTTIAGQTVLEAGRGTEVAFTALGAQRGYSCLHVHVDGVLESQECVQGVSVSEAPLRLGAGADGVDAFDGWMWRPEMRRNALLPDELADRDRDGVPDALDSCIGDANGPRAGSTTQLDVDGDGFGNACDADFDEDGFVGLEDFGRFREAYGTVAGDAGYDPEVDFDGNGAVGLHDYSTFRRMLGGRPGPSAIACDGTLGCYGN
jgi:hypothetical protein